MQENKTKGNKMKESKSHIESIGLKPRLFLCNTRWYEDGCGALQIELHPATIDHQGSIMIEFINRNQHSNQVHNNDSNECGAGFDWVNTLKFRIGIVQVATILQVLLGIKAYTEITITRKSDKIVFDVRHDADSDGIVMTAHVISVEKCSLWKYVMPSEEVLVFQYAMEHSMGKMAFGE